MKAFNILAICVPEKHYMVDTTNKLNQIMQMIDEGNYFTINRPRQYGKTTTISLLWRKLLNSEEYIPIFSSFEEWGDDLFVSTKMFCPRLFRDIKQYVILSNSKYKDLFNINEDDVDSFNKLFDIIENIIKTTGKKLVLIIDEVDRASNFDLLINFLGILRGKYIKASMGLETTFHSVILAGVHDVKNLKQQIRPDSEAQLNSPWNIAADFEVAMTFNPTEIETMLADYVADTGNQMDTKTISERIYFWTSGYPFLVSKACKVVAEKILPKQESKTWDVGIIDQAVDIVIKDKSTLIESLIKNLEKYSDLYQLMESLTLGCEDIEYIWQNPIIDQAIMYGFITCNGDNKARVHNKIFQEVVINYILSKNKTKYIIEGKTPTPKEYITSDGKLNFEKILLEFQKVMQEKYSNNLMEKTEEFVEKDLRLLFLVFLHPIINGVGYSFKEVEIGGEKRLDVVVTYRDELFVVELKIWRGPEYHEEGKQRLLQYMQNMHINKGYMLIMYKTKTKTFENGVEDGILMVYV